MAAGAEVRHFPQPTEPPYDPFAAFGDNKDPEEVWDGTQVYLWAAKTPEYSHRGALLLRPLPGDLAPGRWGGYKDTARRPSEPSWIAPFTGLSPRVFGKLVTVLRREGADAVRKGRPWSLPLEDRALLVAVYWRTNLTMRQLAPLFGVSKSAADRIIDHLGPMLALQPRKRFGKDTVLIVDGTLVPTRGHAVAQ